MSSLSNILLAVASQFIWYSEYIKIYNKTIYYHYFSQNLNYIGDLFENNGKMRSLEEVRGKSNVDDHKKFYCRQIIYTIPLAWKTMLLQGGKNICNLIINENHLIKNIKSIV